MEGFELRTIVSLGLDEVECVLVFFSVRPYLRNCKVKEVDT